MKWLQVVSILLALAVYDISGEKYELTLKNLDADPAELWELYKTTFGRVITSADESERFRLFQLKLDQIRDHNSKFDEGKVLYRQGLNRFTDKTSAEPHQTCFHSSPDIPTNDCRPFYNGPRPGTPPSSFDWRNEGIVTTPRHQGDCGSCWAFAAVGAIEGQHAAATGRLVSFSEQHLIDCSVSSVNDGCDGGDQAIAYQDIIENMSGLESLATTPYLGKKDTSRNCNSSTPAVQLSSFVSCLELEESLIMRGIYTSGPATVSVHVSDEFEGYESGIFEGPCTGDVDHAVLIVGYGVDGGNEYWIIKNSWGTADWGEGGFMRMRKGEGLCGITSEISFPIIDTTSSGGHSVIAATILLATSLLTNFVIKSEYN